MENIIYQGKASLELADSERILFDATLSNFVKENNISFCVTLTVDKQGQPQLMLLRQFDPEMDISQQAFIELRRKAEDYFEEYGFCVEARANGSFVFLTLKEKMQHIPVLSKIRQFYSM